MIPKKRALRMFQSLSVCSKWKWRVKWEKEAVQKAERETGVSQSAVRLSIRVDQRRQQLFNSANQSDRLL